MLINTKFKFKIKDVSRKYNIPESVVEEIFNSQFKFYRTKMGEMDLTNITTEEDYNNLKHIFYFKYIGKFFISWNKLVKIREAVEKKNNKLNNGED